MAEQVQEREKKEDQQKQDQRRHRTEDARKHGGGDGEEESKENETEKKDDQGLFEKHPKAKPALILFLVVLLTGGGIWYWHHRQFQSTDDAQVQANVYAISARISGHVVRVTVNDGDRIRAGQVLAEIDPTDYQVAYDRARANYEQAQAALLSAELNVPISSVGSRSEISTAEAGVLNSEAAVSAAQQQQTAAQEELAQAQASASKANNDLARYSQLINKREISQLQYDQFKTAADAQNAAVGARVAALKAASDQVSQTRSRMTQATAALQNARVTPKQVASTQARSKGAQAALDLARTALRQAQLNLGYTKVVAPVEGIIGRRTVTNGQNVQPGEDLMSLVPVYDVWITANFRETQLQHMKAGQPVRIHVDTYGRDWKGHVSNIGGATGAIFSLLPPENATGNYVKVVQRIPVRIDVDNGNRDGMLRPGMSAEPHVRIR
jgi:membrane fusion protein, multidrug efflux system